MSYLRTMEPFSCFLSTTLGCFGYNNDIIQQRIQLLQEDNRICGVKKVLSPFECVSVGSKGEGIVSIISSSSDGDIMQILKDVICVEQAQDDNNFHILESDLTVDTYPGYTRVVRQNHHEDWYFSYEDFNLNLFNIYSGFLLYFSESQYISNKGRAYLSSPLFKNKMFEAMSHFLPYLYNTTFFEYNGPAFTARAKTTDLDIVPAVDYFETKYLNKWKTRRRLYEWPMSALITEISTSEGYIVPIGSKSSENQHLEWHICFTTSELKLIQNMNNVQLQLYVLLKMVKRHFLAPLSKSVTSYVIKNIVFWISETSPIRMFTPSNLVNLLKRCLMFLAFCIRNNHLLNYMISDRNLLHGTLAVLERTHLLKTLSDILQNIEKFLLEIPELGKFMSCAYCRPDCVSLYGPWRDSVEKLLIAWVCLKEKCSPFILRVNDSNTAERAKRCFSDRDFLPIVVSLYNLTIPDWSFLIMTQQYDEFRKRYTKSVVLLDFDKPS